MVVVGADWTLHPWRHNSSNVGGVIANQARHNSSNVGGVTVDLVGDNSSSYKASCLQHQPIVQNDVYVIIIVRSNLQSVSHDPHKAVF